MRLLEQLSRCSSDFEYSHSSVDVFFDDDSSVYNKLTHDNFLQLFNALQSNTNLNHVNVNNLDIGFETLLTVFKQFSTHQSPPTIEVLPHSIDFSRGTISYDNKVTNTDLRLLLNALKSSVPIKRVQSNGIADLDFDTLLTIHQIYSINNSLIDVDISPHFIDTESGIFYFSPQDHTQITPEIVSDLQSLNIKNLGIHECYFVDDAFDSFCDLIRTSTSLTSLDLSDCYIHAYFLKLIDALQSNSKLNNVNLSNHSIGFRGLLTIFDLVSAGKLTSNIQFSPHSCDFSNGAICYDSHVGTADLCTLLSALKSNVPIKRVDCRGLKTLSFEGIITLFEILFIKKSVVDIDVSPHSIDFSRCIIQYDNKITNTDLGLLLNALKSNVPIKRVEFSRLKNLSLGGIITSFEILSINKSVIDVDVFPHFVDIDNGAFHFSPETFTQISA
ncbi:hypothetical protein GEMRC1_009600 [Eukaryota sp. GEM-RC1]